jgi:hypothetical protein
MGKERRIVARFPCPILFFHSGDLNESRTAYKQFDGTVAN